MYAHYAPEMQEDVRKLNNPTITDKVDPKKLEECWPQIRKIIEEELPETEKLVAMMKVAGAPITPDAVNVDPQFMENAMRYHAYLRYRLTIPRLMPMMGLDIMEYLKED